MSVRSKGISAATALAMTGALCGIGANAAYAASAEDAGAGTATVAQAATAGQTRAGADEICTVLGIGSGAAGLSKALAKGASWVGIGASVGCYLYSKAKNATPAEKRAAMIKSYKKYQAMSDLKKLDALGYYCRKKDSGGGGGGGGGTDVAPLNTRLGWTDIKMKGVTYTCTATGD
ncbi:hypothetical protein [Streptomyces viridochromogenes]|uniref:hypothetical protein n=1 Tax=Streptomyces viridochromogenes TaxID=1938 RepID=UPI00069F73F7|nr:hypothetical protein [Streptomyces viridochromogenes]KOG24463.1 hypothetical protein ADK36_08055 [Streptomyces viridochromogenes]KOG24626.1 hypothetical protein ADK35_10665 [Streptomyces viridochromogenes]